MPLSAGTLAPYLPELVLGAGVLLLLLWGIAVPRRGGAALSLFSLAVLAAALVLLLRRMAFVGWGEAAFASPESFRSLFRAMSLLAASVTVLLSHDRAQEAPDDAADHQMLILLATLGMMFTAGAENLLLLFLGIELMSLSFVLLTGLGDPRERAREAALKYLLYGLAASALLLFGLSLVYGLYGSWDLELIAAEGAGPEAGAFAGLAMIFFLAGLAFKIGLVPFHMWIPDVYAGAPAAVAAFLSVGPKAATLGAAAVFLVAAFGELSGAWHAALWIMAVLSMIWGNVAALAQRSLKRMLAYSSIGQVGYLSIGILAAVSRPVEALGGMGFFLFSYVFFNLGAFSLAIMTEEEGRGDTDLDRLAGLGRRFPLPAGMLALFYLSLAGIPPTAGFMGKLWLFLAAVRSGMTVLAVVGVLASILGAFYYLRVVWYLFFREPSEEESPLELRPGIGYLGLAACALATLWLGVWPEPLLLLARQAAQAAFGAP